MISQQFPGHFQPIEFYKIALINQDDLKLTIKIIMAIFNLMNLKIKI